MAGVRITLHDHQAHLVCLIILQGMSSGVTAGAKLTSFIEINISIVWSPRVWGGPEVQGVPACRNGLPQKMILFQV
jgi:hypothetical protein